MLRPLRRTGEILLEMELEAAADGAGGGVLNGDFFALFGDLVDAVADVGDVEFEIEVARLSLPEGEARGEVGGEMLRQARTVFDDGAAAVAHGAASPKTAPAIAIKNLRRAGVGLVESRNDALSLTERLVAGEASGDGTVENCPGGGVLEARGDAEALKLAHIQDEFKAFRTGAVEIDGGKNSRDGNFVVFETVAAGVEIDVQLETDARS